MNEEKKRRKERERAKLPPNLHCQLTNVRNEQWTSEALHYVYKTNQSVIRDEVDAYQIQIQI